MILNVLSKCFQLPVPVVWKSFTLPVACRATRRGGRRARVWRLPGLQRLG